MKLPFSDLAESLPLGFKTRKPKARGLGVSDSPCTWLLEEGKVAVAVGVFCFPGGPMYYIPIWSW